MMRRFLSIFLLYLTYHSVLGQPKPIKYSKLFNTYYYPGPFSFYLGLGTAAYRGNLCGRPECNTYQLAYNVGAQYKPGPHFAFGGEFNYLNLQAKTLYSLENISFKSEVLELRVFCKFYLNDDKILKSADKRKNTKPLRLYILVGLAGNYYNSETLIGQPNAGKLLTLQGSTFGIPVGGGLHYTPSPKISIIGEVTYLTSFSDKIDILESESTSFLRFLDSYGLILLKLQISPFKK